MNPVLWEPDLVKIRESAMYQFMQKHDHESYASLYQWSIEEAPAFWSAVCEFCGIQFDRPADRILARPDNIMDAGWFEGAQLNFAAHMLRHTGQDAAIVFCGEDGTRQELSRDELRALVASAAAALRARGITKGDRVAGYLPNCPEAIIAMLATAACVISTALNSMSCTSRFVFTRGI
jgi:acetoacetyl-CoA synthetase